MNDGSCDEDRTPPAETPPPGEAVPAVLLPARYLVQRLIGQGGMARVYKAFDTTLRRAVAIKILDAPARARFAREAHAVARIDHPNIVAVHDFDATAGYLVMELVDGETLEASLARGPLPAAEVSEIAGAVLDALAAAHAAGIIHRDVKPSNIMRCRDGRIVLVDFGVARIAGSDVTRTGSQVGTPAFMAPEQLYSDRIDERADLWSVGATLYLLLTGVRFELAEPRGKSLGRLRRSGAELPLRAVVEGCLQTERTRRFPSAQAARAALARRRPRPSRFVLLAAGLLALALASAGAVWRARSVENRELDRAWDLAQHGDLERARDAIHAFVADHPNHARALTLDVLAGWWSGAPEFSGVVEKALAGPISPAQQAMVRGLHFIQIGRASDAIPYLELAERQHPDSPEILYALGEARWHDQRLEAGAATLARSFDRDGRWLLALEHVVELHLAGGRPAALQPFVERLRAIDPIAEAALASRQRFAEQKYAEAAEIARQALDRFPESVLLRDRLAEALVLTGDLDGARRTADDGLARSPLDERTEGPRAHRAELALYRGQVDEYRRIAQSQWHAGALVDVLWLGEAPRLPPRPPELDGPTLRQKPFWVAVYLLAAQRRGIDESAVIQAHPVPEVRAFGEALADEARGDLASAARRYEAALATPSRGDTRPLLAYFSARARHALGDAAGAARACDEVLHPREYQTYRAVLLPDCLVWSAEVAPPALARGYYRQLVDAWRGSPAHPAVAIARARLEQSSR